MQEGEYVMPRCPMCFKEKSELVSFSTRILQPRTISVCRSCAYELDRLAGFLEFNNIGLREVGGALQSEILVDGDDNQAQDVARQSTKAKGGK